jgi:hypothetical protein
MNQEPAVVTRRGWLQRLGECFGFLSRRWTAAVDEGSWAGQMDAFATACGRQLDPRLLLESKETHAEPVMTVADIPLFLRRRLEQETMRAAFRRLEMPLRFLLHATAPEAAPSESNEYHRILCLWRQALEEQIKLKPDLVPGDVCDYDPAIERDYTIRGRCRAGETVRILMPAWRLHGEVVVRGEAEPCEQPVGSRT